MKNKIFVTRVLVTLVLCLILSACNLTSNGGSAINMESQQTSVAQTVSAMQTQLAGGSTPLVPVIVTNTPETLFTNTPEPTPTLTFTPTLAIPTSTATITSTPVPSFKAGNVIDVTYPDNTVVKPSTAFTKTWRITNTGTGTWNSNFKLVFVSGDAMGGPASKPLGKSVAPNESIEVSVALTSPADSKTYQGNWMLQTDSGANFGIGANADGVFWVKIKVDQPFAITKAKIVSSPSTYTGVCPVLIVFSADITSTSSGKATYQFVTSLTTSKLYSLTFAKAETITTGTYSVPVPSTQVVTGSVYVDDPNHQGFNSISVSVTCVP